jgi:hypothetical protein
MFHAGSPIGFWICSRTKERCDNNGETDEHDNTEHDDRADQGDRSEQGNRYDEDDSQDGQDGPLRGGAVEAIDEDVHEQAGCMQEAQQMADPEDFTTENIAHTTDRSMSTIRRA